MMGSLGNPKTWVPYLNNKDCSQGFCSLYCPQWCYIIYPPPPPPPTRAAATSASISPLSVSIIGVLASAFLLVAYYVLISKLCGRRLPNERTRLPSSSTAAAANEDSAEPPPPHEAWHVTTAGLDEAAIAAIEVRKYRRNGGGAENCSVCLSEFGEEESVRLLPKCEHAFHVPCIDTWLRSHSNCPLCRAAVVADCCLPGEESSEMMAGEESGDDDRGEAESVAGDLSAAEKSGGDDSSSSRGSELERHAVIEVRRSVSMDFSPARDRVSVAENDLMIGTDCDCEDQDHRVDVDQEFGNHGKVNGCGSQRRKGILHCVVSPVVMKRSVSSGRFFLRRNSVIPL